MSTEESTLALNLPGNLALNGVHCDKRFPWSLRFKCMGDLPQFRNLSPKKRKEFLKDNPKFLKHGFLVCLFVEDELITLGTLVREENLLVQTPSILCIQIPATNVEKVLMQLKNAGTGIRLLHIDTAIFTYEPVLRQLQDTQQLILTSEILAWQPGTLIPPPEYYLSSVIEILLQNLNKDYTCNLQQYLQLNKPTRLDKAQAECFRAALQQRVVLIQGPPGTGKSFIGSLIGKVIYQCSHETILVVCYTHHALDDFVEDLIYHGIPSNDIVRLGSSFKATDSTKPLALKEYKQFVKFTHEQSRTYKARKRNVTEYAKNLRNAFYEFNPRRCTRDLLKFLESYNDDLPFYSALQVPKDPDGMTWVGSRGEELDECYLLDRWVRGKDAGIFNSEISPDCRAVWHLEHDVRKHKENQWYHELSKDSLALLCKAGKLYNHGVERLDAAFLKKDLAVLQNKRIIACTTTAAAKYSDVIHAVSPGVLLVEEAGEILESHVLTALGPDTKHLILIGDHKQLRPKVNHELSVEKGTGYDLNRSLFERLILKEFPHQTLFSQHRMRPEISALVREMTYPELEDAKETQKRPNLRGFTDYIIFVNHNEPESELSGTRELCDSTALSSKQNLFEAKMTLKCVRYLGQQGYSSDDIVVLTPYLGQLRLLHDELKVDNNLMLNDLDSHDLVRAGLMPEATAEVNKPRLRISTIDNFQGEEANIVVASLTRSNSNNNIGFMSAPERLNVLISRARNALILIVNAEHFMGSRKGGDLWKRFISLLKANKHMYNGFPIRCEQHPDCSATLQKPADFDVECPNGGCKEPCDKILNCGIHKCPKRCHYLLDHSKVKCRAIISIKCDRGHVDHCEYRDRDECTKCEMEIKEEISKLLFLRNAENKTKNLEMRDENESIKATKEGSITLEKKQNGSEPAKDIAKRKLTSNDTSNSVTMGANAVGVIPDLAPNSRMRQVLQSSIIDCEIQTISQSACLKTEASELQTIGFKQDKRDLLTAKNFAPRKLASYEVLNALTLTNADEWAQNRVPRWQELLEKAKSEYEIQAARTETIKQQIIALEKTKRDLQIVNDVAESNLASDETSNARTESTNSGGSKSDPTSDTEWRQSLLRIKIDLEIQNARTTAAKKQVIALERKKWNLETLEDDEERKLTADETPNIRTLRAKSLLPSSNPNLNTVINQRRTQAMWRSSRRQHSTNMLDQITFSSIVQRARPLGSKASSPNKPKMLHVKPRFL